MEKLNLHVYETKQFLKVINKPNRWESIIWYFIDIGQRKQIKGTRQPTLKIDQNKVFLLHIIRNHKYPAKGKLIIIVKHVDVEYDNTLSL